MKRFQFISVVCLSLSLAFFASGCASKKGGGSAGIENKENPETTKEPSEK